MLRFKGSSRSQVLRTLPNEYNFQSVYDKFAELLAEHPHLLTFFSRPIPGYNQTFVWEASFVKNAEVIRSIDELSEDEKSLVLDYLETAKYDIAKLIKEEPYFKTILEKIFYVPNEEDIKVHMTDAGIKVFLIQWGHKLLDDETRISPLTRILNAPRPDRSRVEILIKYSNGTIASNKDFCVNYLGQIQSFITNEEGTKNLGFYKLESNIIIYDVVDGQNKYEHSFTVSEDCTYEVVFPLLASAQFKIVNQKKETLSNIDIVIDYDGNQWSDTTRDTGVLELNNLEVSADITFSLGSNYEVNTVYEIEEENNIFVLQIEEPVYSESSLKIVNQNGKIIPDQAILIEYKNTQNEYWTNQDGIINLNKFEIGNIISVTEIDKEKNNQSFTLEKTIEEFVFQIEITEPKFVKIRLVDKEDKPISNTKIYFDINGVKEVKTTDKEGLCIFPFESFQDGKKVKAVVHLVEKNKKGEEKIKKIKKSFKFKKSILSYTLKLKKTSKWWLLLLLLLLFIPYNKEVCVKVLDGQSSIKVPNANVSFQYHQQFLYNVDRLSIQADSIGLANFVELRTSGFSFLYSLITNSKAIASASNSSCFGSDTIHHRFHNLIWLSDTIELRLRPTKSDLNFKVVDKIDLEPLPDAMVIIESEYLGEIYIDSASSDANGRVLFNGINRCGVIRKVRGDIGGYLPDSIINKTLQKLQGDIDDKRLLKLAPETNRIVFFVVDCATKRKIPGALVAIDMGNNTSKKTQPVHTNVNGIGKGHYDEVHVLSEITLIGEHHPFYGKGTLPKYLVRDFVKLPDSLRTICLPPKPNLVTFKNMDNYSQTNLSGVTNEISIKKVGETEEHIIISDANGEFVFNIGVNDTVSILSTYPPDYQDNDTTVQKVIGFQLISGSAKNRMIPLSPKIVKLLFRTIEDQNIQQKIPEVSINTELLVNGRTMSLNIPSQSDMNGEFILEVPVTAMVSINASKPGYRSNNNKIQMVSVRTLIASHQIQRDIPLKKLPPACNSHVKSGEDGVTIDSYDMENKDLALYIDYNMATEPDEITVYCGQKNNLGKVLFQTPGKVGGTGHAIINLSDCDTGGGWITVRVDGGNSTVWSYNIVCP